MDDGRNVGFRERVCRIARGINQQLVTNRAGSESSTNKCRLRKRSRDQPPVSIVNLYCETINACIVFCKVLSFNIKDSTHQHLMLVSAHPVQLIQCQLIVNPAASPVTKARKETPRRTMFLEKPFLAQVHQANQPPTPKSHLYIASLTKKRRPQRPADAVIIYNQSEVFV